MGVVSFENDVSLLRALAIAETHWHDAMEEAPPKKTLSLDESVAAYLEHKIKSEANIAQQAAKESEARQAKDLEFARLMAGMFSLVTKLAEKK